MTDFKEIVGVKGIDAPVATWTPDKAIAISGGSAATGIAIHPQLMEDGTDTICIVISKPDFGMMTAMLTFDQFNSMCHIAADIIEAANERDRPASMGTMQ